MLEVAYNYNVVVCPILALFEGLTMIVRFDVDSPTPNSYV
jgi:hypothetical protein